MTTKNTNELERHFRALANRKRLDILRLIAKRELPLHGVAQAIRLSVKSTNKHLQQLHHVGLAEKSRRGNEVYYSLPSDMTELVRRLLKLVLE